jgi:homoserine O-acetyltransferase/O-succinyltransferase
MTRVDASEIVGPPGAPVVVVLGGISASRHVTSSSANPRPGWWEQFCGPGRPINTDRFRILSIDYQAEGKDGQSLTTYDQALALGSALDWAGVKSVRAIIGASYGGMVALAFGAIAPYRVRRLVVIGAAHESAPTATALRLLQRRVVELGLATGKSHEALVLARGIAMTSYASADEFDRRFAGAASDDAGQRSDAIGDFLQLSGETFARNCTPERFLALSESLDSHHVAPEEIRVPTTLIAVREDALVPIEQVQHLARHFGASCRLVELSSSHGHDTFLNAHHLIAPFVVDALFAAKGLES